MFPSAARPVIVFDDPLLESARAEAMARLVESVVSVRRRYQFFVWMQNHLQSLLPHQIAVCGCYHRASRELGFEVFNSVVLAPDAAAVLADAHSSLMRTATAAWIQSGAQPVVVQLSSFGTDASDRGMHALRDAGLVQFLAHGVARPQRPSELETFFLFASPHCKVTAAQSVSVELLMPYLHSMYLRVQSTEQEIGGAANASRPRMARAVLTDRERQVLSHVREGLSNQQIGEAMGISALTVKNHVQKLLRKLGAANRAQAVAKTSTTVVTADHDEPERPAAPRHERGFTLLELLVVMVIIGLLAGYVGPKVFAQIGKSEVKVAKAQIDALHKALDQYRVDTGRYPSSAQGLQALVRKPTDEPRWGGPYLLKSVPQDPWQRDYHYRQPGEHGDFDLLSLGRDGRPGGEGEDADLVSW